MQVFVLFESNPWTGMNTLGVYTTHELAMEAAIDHDGLKTRYYIVPCDMDNPHPLQLYPRKHEVYTGL